MKIVIDTNVIISGIFFGGSPAHIISNVSKGLWKIVLSESIIFEYKEVCVRLCKKMNHKDLISVLEIIDALVADALVINPNGIETPFCEDPDDIIFLQAAISSKAKYLVSGDKHLLNVKKYPGGEILNPNNFLKRMEN